ncbi:MAG TPA: DUF2007 domain-containing protein [Syntrophomonadaceae bacterium]|nr:DUF2007 domain-containing protein [Syntrophomonadaceae bacterium]
MQNRQLDKWVFLCNVRDIYELEWLKNFFAQNGVPILHKSRGTGVYMQILMGIVSTGYDVYVPNQEISLARVLLEEMNQVPKDDEFDFNNFNNYESIFAKDTGTGYILKHRLQFKKLFLILVMIPLLVGMFYWVIDIIRRILID